MPSSIIDTHAHLDMKPFDPDRRDVIKRAKESGVSRIVNVGIDLKSSRRAIELAEAHTEISATVGFHPHEASQLQTQDLDRLAELAVHPRVVAIGEIGLDYYRNRSPKETQLYALQAQLDLAKNLSLPVVIHSRQAETDMVAMLEKWTSSFEPSDQRIPGVIHCFNGSAQIAERYLEMGFLIAFGAYIGYPTSTDLHNIVSSIPSDRLVAETDCPFLPPQRLRGKRNEPSYLLDTIKALAKIRKVSVEVIAMETTRNATRLFGLPA
ncbi:MAG: TatD family hydrolase [Chloroflexota bacterium]|nr:TatD family hydrolase [Chloroflexota bacterium]